MNDMILTIAIALVLQLALFVIVSFKDGAKTTDFLVLAILTLLGAFYEQNREILCLLEKLVK